MTSDLSITEAEPADVLDVRPAGSGGGEPARLRSYSSYVGGQDVAAASWTYVVSSRALLDDAFASLSLKRKLERGDLAATGLPDAIVARVAKADAEVIQRALRAAAEAAPVWGATPLEIKCEQVGRLIHAALIEKADELIEVLLHEGHPLALARWEVSGMLETFGPESLAFYSRQMRQEWQAGERRIMVRRQPDGVVCVNPPANAPLASALLGAISIMAGNAVIVRAPRSGPLGVMYVLRDLLAPILEQVAAPPGTLNVICGDPGPMLDAWLKSPLVDDIMYFGTSESGIRFQAACVAAQKKPILELAGNDVVVVWKDADPELAAEALTESFYGSGQLCMIPNQVLVHPDIADRLLPLLAAQAAAIRPGYPQDEGVLLSPVLRNEMFFDFLADAQAKGAELVCGGHSIQLDGSRDTTGLFLEPTVVRVNGLAGARELDAVRNETFFPLLPVIVAEPADDATLIERFIDYVNSNEHGLRNSVWARDEQVIEQFVNRITAGGLLKVNDSHIGFLPYLPTHGGTGRTGGVFGEANYPILRTSHLQGVSVSPGTRPKDAVFGAWDRMRALRPAGHPAPATHSHQVRGES